MKYYFTSESISEGHPDKIADQISDAVLDACLAKDTNSRVACEVFTSTGFVLVGGEITTNTWVDFAHIARDTVKDIGYTNSDYGINADTMAVMTMIGQQSPDIAKGVDTHGKVKLGAGDQGMMFGYACDETKELMPASIMLSHKLLQHAAHLRKTHKDFSWLRPDAKSQVTVEYENKNIINVNTVVLSHQHDPTINGKTISQKWIAEQIKEHIIIPVLEPTGLLKKNTKYHINPTGRFVIGGPHADAGLTGRKIVADTYGGVGHHGGGAFSGKDPTKVDRSAAYMARYIAKNIVAAKIAKQCELQLAYAIGIDAPVSVMVNTFGTGKINDNVIAKKIQKIVDLTPWGIIHTLQLQRPIYKKTSVYGHFGKTGKEFSWEQTNLVHKLQKELE